MYGAAVCVQVFVLLTSGCVLLPLVSIPTFHKLRFVSLLSVGSMVYVTFVVVFRGAVRQRESFAELKAPQKSLSDARRHRSSDAHVC